MAGIYLHIPFCRQACHYCDFHFSTSLRKKDEMVHAIKAELSLRKNYLEGELVETIYLGGGTPSLLSGDDLKMLLHEIHRLLVVDENAEITLEANPDDLTKTKLNELKEAGINRLSIGLQSFRDEDLKWMNRSHQASQGEYCVKAAQDKEITNISIDLIYALPTQTNAHWKENLNHAFALSVPHISAYALTIEPKTYFGRQHLRGLLSEVSQDQAADQFMLMLQEMQRNQFEQYEVSNFARDNQYSRHNTAYWQGKNYLGVGPSAHSFNTRSRQWNVSNNAQYLNGIAQKKIAFEVEELSTAMRINEYIMTGLRTKWGVNTSQLMHVHDYDLIKEKEEQINKLITTGEMKKEKDCLVLTPTGLLKADAIAASLFL